MSCIMEWFETIGRARAASHMTRLGYYEEAKRLMMETKQLEKVKNDTRS